MELLGFHCADSCGAKKPQNSSKTAHPQDLLPKYFCMRGTATEMFYVVMLLQKQNKLISLSTLFDLHFVSHQGINITFERREVHRGFEAKDATRLSNILDMDFHSFHTKVLKSWIFYLNFILVKYSNWNGILWNQQSIGFWWVEGWGKRVIRRGNGKRRVNKCGEFLLSQQRLSISQWLRHSLEEGSRGGGLDCAAPCVASLPLLMNSTTGAVGLWELPGLSLQRHYNMQNCPQREFGILSEKGGCQTGTTAFTHTWTHKWSLHHTWCD